MYVCCKLSNTYIMYIEETAWQNRGQPRVYIKYLYIHIYTNIFIYMVYYLICILCIYVYVL